MNIRPGLSTDAPVIAEFNLRLARESEDLALAPETVRLGVEALIKDPAKGIYYVAEENGAVVGQLCLTYEWSDWRNGNFWWIQSVYVKPESRGRGVFSALFEHVQTLARRQKNVCGLRLYMEEHNERARRAYLKLGFAQTHYQIFECAVREAAAGGLRS